MFQAQNQCVDRALETREVLFQAYLLAASRQSEPDALATGMRGGPPRTGDRVDKEKTATAVPLKVLIHQQRFAAGSSVTVTTTLAMFRSARTVTRPLNTGRHSYQLRGEQFGVVSQRIVIPGAAELANRAPSLTTVRGDGRSCRTSSSVALVTCRSLAVMTPLEELPFAASRLDRSAVTS